MYFISVLITRDDLQDFEFQ